ncbi:MAG: SRPBCC family protein [Azonexus sp.]
MAEYRLLSIWRIEAPVETVYTAILGSLGWPAWWPGVQEVETLAEGDSCGIGNIRRYTWQGELPYRLTFAVHTTRIDPGIAIEGRTEGDLEGVGRWHFARQGTACIVRFEWHVRTTRWWMSALAPLARGLFIEKHAQFMARGGAGLARLLGAPPVSQLNVDLSASCRPPVAAPGRWRERGRLDPLMVALAGMAAGTLATAAQLLYWWMSQVPLAETLFRDARLTAALLMGPAVLPPPATAQWDILLVATLLHFLLSIAYALPPARLFETWRGWRLFAGGCLYGLALYVINLYGFVLLFPWFAVARDGASLFAHIAFGLTLAGCYRLFSRNP